MPTIATIHAREILDSRGNPTVEVDVVLDDGSLGRAAVPSGASTGTLEATELRDGEVGRFGGKGVRRAVGNVENEIAPVLRGREARDQRAVDQELIALDGTGNKSRLGANAILGVSMAVARASAVSARKPLFETLRPDAGASLLPVPMFNVLNGGVHADNTVDFQEFMIAPVGAASFREALRTGAETYHSLATVLKNRGYGTSVGDEGGFAPKLSDDREALELLVEAIERAGYRPGVDVVIALDPAASELYVDGAYVFRKSGAAPRTSERMIELFEGWSNEYPIWSIEDGLAEGDWPGWELATSKLGTRVQLVGDDIFVTNPKIIRKAIARHVANAALIKPNQIGTVSETLDAVDAARAGGYGTVVSHRSGETVDDFIADFAVASAAGQIKTGAPARGERLAKYNQLARIEERLGPRARYAGNAFLEAGGFRRS